MHHELRPQLFLNRRQFPQEDRRDNELYKLLPPQNTDFRKCGLTLLTERFMQTS
ncbi:hypothetical protein F441_19806 [Phytophthora nicotianae CJ01A1]|uniref:Uncharacterized protein n=1 Tax=Phytophthora nicotianae CJ01A1 TaxID=1317063 RepID=W2W0T8_PHYNI|nr:hypothetical protein F441_19806 [Phytophthora nicotianae CJ01A1]